MMNNILVKKRLLASTMIMSGRALLGGAALVAGGIGGSLALTTPAFAQDITSGTLSGSVEDASGNAISGATVVVTARDRALTRTVTTGSSGEFNITQLPLGTYSITGSKAGLASVRVNDVPVVLGGSSYTLTLTAETAESGDVIVVTGQKVRTIDFSQAATGQVFNVQEVASRVPVARTIQDLQLLAPQSVGGDPTFDAGTDSSGGAVSLAGSSIAENIFYVNGMNITNFRTFVGGSTVPFEFYDQVQVKTGGYQAEFGRSTGGAVIAVTRSGSNELRGGMNAFWNPSFLRAKTKDSYIADNGRDERQDYEGNIWASGPIIKDRLYFFGFFNPQFNNSTDFTRRDIGADSYTKTYISSKKPFFGGKLDADITDGHRLEFTYFNDSQAETERATVFDTATNEVTSESDNTKFSGGSNMIAKYTGSFTDWLTVSALWGRSKFNQTSAGSQDTVPFVYDDRTNELIYVQGNPNLLIEFGNDKRELFRGDVDIYANFAGQHHFRFGVDHEILTASNTSTYSGGQYYRFFRAGAAGAFNGAVAPFQDYVRARQLNSGGTFKSKNTAFYLQDSWDVTDRLNLNLGIRNDRFQNLNAAGSRFTDLKNQWAPRVAVTFDPTGDKRTKLSAFFGRYFLPVAANTNIRMAGNETFYQQFYTFSGPITNPTLLTKLSEETLSESNNADPRTLVSQNIKPQYLDEFIVGAERRLGDRWRVGVNLIHRNLKSVLEDTDLNQFAGPAFCATQNLPGCNPDESPNFGSGGYVLLNPGKDVVVSFTDPDGGIQDVVIPAAIVGLPKATRKYWAVELTFDREFDGVWGLSGSYVWSKSRGNYEGGVKSDNGQDDTGLTQDFDEPGWVDGAYGSLPNDRRHVFKLFGSYAVSDRFTVGGNLRVASPRKYGCIGIYPFTDGRAVDPYEDGGADSWYCGDRTKASVDAEGNPISSGSVLVGRGKGFKGDWQKQVDLSFQYNVPVEGWRGVTLRADIYNVFNFGKAIDHDENGDDEGVITQNANGTVSVPLNVHYGDPIAFQTPRYVRLSASINF